MRQRRDSLSAFRRTMHCRLSSELRLSIASRIVAEIAPRSSQLLSRCVYGTVSGPVKDHGPLLISIKKNSSS